MKYGLRSRLSGFFTVLVLIFVACQSLLALEPPTKEQIEKYKQDGSLKRRIEAAYKSGNHQMDPYLLERMKANLQIQALKAAGKSENDISIMAPPLGRQGMPSKGDVNIFIILVAFNDYPPIDSKDDIENRIFGEGDNGYPYESLTQYYERSSYNQLHLQGHVFDWYTTSYNRSAVAENWQGRQALIKEVLNYHNAQGHDFTQYDNNDDGVIDYFGVIWTGPRGEWADFWWGWQITFIDDGYTLDGKSLRKYSFQWESRNYPQGTFSPGTLIHETGHGLGLPDYYDYDDNIGPRGGVGYLDMMAGSWGDHNCFSKYVLEWITPEYISTGEHNVILRPSSSDPDALLIMPGVTENSLFEEFYMVQNRHRIFNDTGYPNDGLLIWHVNAYIDGTNYIYDNQYADYKLLRLMEADGLEQIEAGFQADAGDFYTEGSEFSPFTFPSSDNYSGDSTGIAISDITRNGNDLTLNAEVQELPDVDIVSPLNKDWISGVVAIEAEAEDSSGIEQVEFFVNDVSAGIDYEYPYEINIDTLGLPAGLQTIKVTATNNNGLRVSETRQILKIEPGINAMVVDISSDNDSGQKIGAALQANDVTPIYLDSLDLIDKSIAPLAFICLGYSNGAYSLTEEDSNLLINYLNAGGMLYLEGGETWAYNEDREIHNYFGIDGLSDGLDSGFTRIRGVVSTITDGFYLTMTGESSWVDQLGILDGVTDAYSIWTHTLPSFICGIVRDTGVYKTIGCSFEFGNIPEDSRNDVMAQYLEFFNVQDEFSSTYSYKIPHIAETGWNSVVTLYNGTESWSLFKVRKWDENGALVSENNYSVPPQSESSLSHNEFGTDGIAEVLTYNPDVSVKLSYQYGQSESLSEFFIKADKTGLKYIIPNTIQPWFDWFGLALANFNDTDAVVTLKAYRNGVLKGTEDVTITPGTKYVDTSDNIWNGLTYEDIDMVLVESDIPICTPVSITGNSEQDRHVFFSGQSVETVDQDSYTYYLPHIAEDIWTTSITVYNPSDDVIDFGLEKLDPQGNSTTTQYQVNALNFLTLTTESDFEPLGSAKISADSEIFVKLSYRYATSESLAEFFVDGMTGTRWLLPNPNKDWFHWFGLGLMNFNNQDVSVTLTAYSTRNMVGEKDEIIISREKLVDTSNGIWQLEYSDLDLVIIESDSPISCPISITGNDSQDRHVFFRGQPLKE